MADGTELARWAEGNHPGWAVVWGAYSREFTAWAMWSSSPLVVTAPNTHRLSIAIRRAEQRRVELMPRTSVGTWRSGPSPALPPPELHGPEVAGHPPPDPPVEGEPPRLVAPGPWFVPARPVPVAVVHTEGSRWSHQAAAAVSSGREADDHAGDRAA